MPERKTHHLQNHQLDFSPQQLKVNLGTQLKFPEHVTNHTTLRPMVIHTNTTPNTE